MNNGNQLINKPLNAAPKIAPRRPLWNFQNACRGTEKVPDNAWYNHGGIQTNHR